MQWVHNKRKEKGLTQQELADLIPISQGTLSRIERELEFPDAMTWKRLAEVLEYEGFPFSFTDISTGKKLDFRILAHRIIEKGGRKSTLLTTDDNCELEIPKEVKSW